MSTTIYGIKNCDSIKKTIKWLEKENIPFDFYDYRKAGITEELLTSFIQALGWEKVINKRGTSFRALPAETKDNLTEQSAIHLMLENPAMIKRPVLSHNSQLFIGFSIENYQQIFNEEA